MNWGLNVSIQAHGAPFLATVNVPRAVTGSFVV